MKKRFLAVLFAGLMALSCAACGGGGTLEVPENTKAPENNQQTVKPVGYVLTMNDQQLFIGQNMKNVYSLLGEEAKIRESGSCKYDGTEKEYKFAHITITAIIEGDVERIFSIVFEDDMVSTDEGVAIGDPASKISIKYGKPENEGNYVYNKDGMYVLFTVKNDEVATVVYTEP